LAKTHQKFERKENCRFNKAEYAGSRTIVYYDEHGNATTHSGGSRAWRNNNPGNLVMGPVARRHGVIGEDGAGFAIFPDVETGLGAMEANLGGPDYRDLPLDGAIRKWSPDGSAKTYIRNVQEFTGFDDSRMQRSVGSLSEEDFEAMTAAMRRQKV
jgi:hypothetical protein